MLHRLTLLNFMINISAETLLLFCKRLSLDENMPVSFFSSFSPNTLVYFPRFYAVDMAL